MNNNKLYLLLQQSGFNKFKYLNVSYISGECAEEFLVWPTSHIYIYAIITKIVFFLNVKQCISGEQHF